MKIGFAQEIITPPIGVDLDGYFNERLNVGMYDDLYVKSIVFETAGKRCGIVVFDLLGYCQSLRDLVRTRVAEELGQDLADGLIITATHTHTGPRCRALDGDNKALIKDMADAAFRSIKRSVANLQDGELEAASVYNNPYAFVRRYFMKSGAIVTNPGWRNPEIDRPESEFDRTIEILGIRQGGRLAALICNIANHGDTIGGNLVSADWYGRMTQAIQYELKESIPVLILDDASGDINHFDFRQDIKQTGYGEAVRIGRGYARIVLDALKDLKPINTDFIKVSNGTVTIPHRKLTEAELAEAQHILDTVPDIKKDGDFESQDLANKVPAALRHFAQRALDCHAKSKPSHSCRMTNIRVGDSLMFSTLPGKVLMELPVRSVKRVPANILLLWSLLRMFPVMFPCRNALNAVDMKCSLESILLHRKLQMLSLKRQLSFSDIDYRMFREKQQRDERSPAVFLWFHPQFQCSFCQLSCNCGCLRSIFRSKNGFPFFIEKNSVSAVQNGFRIQFFQGINAMI